MSFKFLYNVDLAVYVLYNQVHFRVIDTVL